MAPRIGVGIAGSGFVARFHVQSWRGVRDADITAKASQHIGSTWRGAWSLPMRARQKSRQGD